MNVLRFLPSVVFLLTAILVLSTLSARSEDCFTDKHERLWPLLSKNIDVLLGATPETVISLLGESNRKRMEEFGGGGPFEYQLDSTMTVVFRTQNNHIVSITVRPGTPSYFGRQCQPREIFADWPQGRARQPCQLAESEQYFSKLRTLSGSLEKLFESQSEQKEQILSELEPYRIGQTGQKANESIEYRMSPEREVTVRQYRGAVTEICFKSNRHYSELFSVEPHVIEPRAKTK